MHALDPSPFVAAHADDVRAAGRLGPLLDVACGRGRHALAAAAWGLRAVGIDRDAEALGALRDAARLQGLPAEAVRAELETGLALPLRAASFGVVVVVRYLHRALAPALEALLRPGGLLLYETFTARQRELGYGPSRPVFLLEPGELPRLFRGLEIAWFEEHLTEGERPEWLACLVARKPG